MINHAVKGGEQMKINSYSKPVLQKVKLDAAKEMPNACCIASQLAPDGC